MREHAYCELCNMRLISYAEEQRAANDASGIGMICDDCRKQIQPLYARAETAEAELADANRVLWAIAAWHPTFDFQQLYFYHTDFPAGPCGRCIFVPLVNGIPQMTDELRKAIDEAQDHSK